MYDEGAYSVDRFWYRAQVALNALKVSGRSAAATLKKLAPVADP